MLSLAYLTYSMLEVRDATSQNATDLKLSTGWSKAKGLPAHYHRLSMDEQQHLCILAGSVETSAWSASTTEDSIMEFAYHLDDACTAGYITGFKAPAQVLVNGVDQWVHDGHSKFQLIIQGSSLSLRVKHGSISAGDTVRVVLDGVVLAGADADNALPSICADGNRLGEVAALSTLRGTAFETSGESDAAATAATTEALKEIEADSATTEALKEIEADSGHAMVGTSSNTSSNELESKVKELVESKVKELDAKIKELDAKNKELDAQNRKMSNTSCTTSMSPTAEGVLRDIEQAEQSTAASSTSSQKDCRASYNKVNSTFQVGEVYPIDSILGTSNMVVMGDSLQGQTCTLRGVVTFTAINNSNGAEFIAQLDPNFRDSRYNTPFCFPISTMVFFASVEDDTSSTTRHAAVQLEPHGRLRIITPTGTPTATHIKVRLDGITYFPLMRFNKPHECVNYCFPAKPTIGVTDMECSGCLKYCAPEQYDRQSDGTSMLNQCQCEMVRTPTQPHPNLNHNRTCDHNSQR